MRQRILNILYVAWSCEGVRSVEFISMAHYSFQGIEKLVSRSCSSLIDLRHVRLWLTVRALCCKFVAHI